MWHKSAPPLLELRRAARILANCATALILVCAGPAAVLAQDGNAPQLPKGGLQIRNVSAYAVYYSSFLPNGGSGIPTGSAKLPADVGAGGSFEFDWTKFTERTTLSLSYTPSYTGYVRNSSLNALNHALSLNVSPETRSPLDSGLLCRWRSQQFRAVPVCSFHAQQCVVRTGNFR